MSRRVFLAVVALVGVLASATAITAGVTADDPTIRACKHVKRGIVRILRDGAVCKRNEAFVSWSIRGPKGDTGPEGPAGPTGPQGPAGPAGPAGPGLSSLGGLVGLACTTYDGTAGKVDLDISPENLVLVSCDGEGTQEPPPGTGELVINEVDYDQVGTDTGGFVEVANVGTGTATLDGVSVVLVNGDGTEYGRVGLTGSLLAGGHLRVEAEPQNGAPDGIALLDQAGTLLDALSYEGEIRSATIGGQTYDLVEGTPLSATVADSNTVDGSLARLPDGADTDNAATDWGFTTTPTPGAANIATG